jgi:hypothetical protein
MFIKFQYKNYIQSNGIVRDEILGGAEFETQFCLMFFYNIKSVFFNYFENCWKKLINDSLKNLLVTIDHQKSPLIVMKRSLIDNYYHG